jgi:hypothetical protein
VDGVTTRQQELKAPRLKGAKEETMKTTIAVYGGFNHGSKWIEV